jgi:hypothetical protein
MHFLHLKFGIFGSDHGVGNYIMITVIKESIDFKSNKSMASNLDFNQLQNPHIRGCEI